jgi:SAM-dependent methyltransferase
MNWNAKTIQTYDTSAEALAEHFKDRGPRVHDIELALKLADAPRGARVIDIGCGDGRDAAEIIKRTAWYEGFDPSEGLLKLARRKLPQTSFVRADALSYNYPSNLDVVYAFASLLHVNQADLKKVFEKVSKALRKGGIFYISLKERAAYAEEVKKDKHGERMFYHYNVALIKELAGKEFSTVAEDHQTIGKTNWFTIALKSN